MSCSELIKSFEGKPMNIWDFNYQKVRLTYKDGDVFAGRIIEISPAEDEEQGEDCVALELSDGRIIGFYESEIKSIEVI